MRDMTKRGGGRAIRILTIGALAIGILAGCGHVMGMMMGTGAERPAAEEFGFGPRGSEGGLYRVTLDPVRPIRVRKLQTMRLVVADAAGEMVDGATITVDGGMPEHGHGLPTQPMVTGQAGRGTYEVEGVKFNMGGWWEVKFAIAGPAGTDSVTFNLDL